MKSCVRGLFACGLVVAVAVSGSVWGLRDGLAQAGKVYVGNGEVEEKVFKGADIGLTLSGEADLSVQAIDVDVDYEPNKKLSLVENGLMTSADKRSLKLTFNHSGRVKMSVDAIVPVDIKNGGIYAHKLEFYPYYVICEAADEGRPVGNDGKAVRLWRSQLQFNMFVNENQDVYVVAGLEGVRNNNADFSPINEGDSLYDDFDTYGDFTVKASIKIEADA